MSNAVEVDLKDEKTLTKIAVITAGEALQPAGIEALLRAEPVEHCLIWR